MAGAVSPPALLLDDVCTGRWLELEGAGGQRRVDLHALETNRRTLAKAVHNVQRRQLFTGKSHAHALQLTIFGLGGGLHPLQSDPGQARRPV